MYSESKVAARLEIAKQEYGKVPTYFSPEEIDAFDAKLVREGKVLYDDTGKPASVLNVNPADADFIQQNQTLVMCDAVYALTRFCYVKNEQNIVQRFKF